MDLLRSPCLLIPQLLLSGSLICLHRQRIAPYQLLRDLERTHRLRPRWAEGYTDNDLLSSTHFHSRVVSRSVARHIIIAKSKQPCVQPQRQRLGISISRFQAFWNSSSLIPLALRISGPAGVVGFWNQHYRPQSDLRISGHTQSSGHRLFTLADPVAQPSDSVPVWGQILPSSQPRGTRLSLPVAA